MTDVAAQGHTGAWWALCVVGACVLMPYNHLLTSQPFFEDHAFKGMGFPFTSMLCYSAPLSISQVVLIFGGEALMLRTRMRAAFASALAVCLMFLLMSILGRFWPKNTAFYVLTLATTAALAISNALMQTGVLGVAGLIGPEMSASVMVGLGFCGLVSLGTSLLVQAVEPLWHTQEANGDAGVIVAGVLFLEATIFTLASAWAYFVYLCKRNDVCSRCIISLESQRKGNAASTRALAMESVTEAGGMGELEVATPSSEESKWRRGALVLRMIAPQAINVFSVFLVTMAIFPGLVLSWKIETGSVFETRVQLFRTLLIGSFQLFDVVGRASAGRASRCVKPRWVWVLVVLRVVFVPLFLFGQRWPEGSVVWGSAVGQLCLVSTMAFTNGLGASLAMMAGPSYCPESRREVAGMAMSCVMVTGIFGGSLLALTTQIGVSQ